MAIEKILNKRSNAVVTGGNPKRPTSSQLDNGEIAVNYHKGTERLFIKNDNEEVVDFIPKNEVEDHFAKMMPYGGNEGTLVMENGLYEETIIGGNYIEFYEDTNTEGTLAGALRGQSSCLEVKHGNTDDPLQWKRIATIDDIPQSDWNTTDTESKSFIKNKPTLDDLNEDSELYALDNSNADYIAAVNALITQSTEIPISHDIEGAKLRVYKRTYGGTEIGSTTTTIIEPSVSEIPYSDGTTFVAYQRGSARYIGLKWNFFDNTSESYTNGNIEVTCEVAGVLKLYFLDCGMVEDVYFKKNGQTTNVKLGNGVLSFDVEVGDVLTVSPTYTSGYQWVGFVGMSITGKYPVSKFANDEGYVKLSDLASVATSGSYNDLSDKPDLSGFITNSVNNLTNYYLKTDTYTKTEVDNKIGDIETLLATI